MAALDEAPTPAVAPSTGGGGGTGAQNQPQPTATPDESWTKAAIVGWLTDRGVAASMVLTKADLLELVDAVEAAQ